MVDETNQIFSGYSNEESENKLLKLSKQFGNLVISSENEQSCDQTCKDTHIPVTEQTVRVNVRKENGGVYGFANRYKNKLQSYEVDISSVVELPDPETTTGTVKKKLREKSEKTHFNVDHYLADFFHTTHGMSGCLIPEVYLYVPPWYRTRKIEDIIFTEEELDVIKSIPMEPIMLKGVKQTFTLYSMIDILLAYVYDYRSTKGEHNCESAWNINKLSATLSWFENFESMRDVVATFMRRTLCFPLYRNYYISRKVIGDVSKILELGRRQLLKCFVSIYLIFKKDENRWILNDLYIKDYIVWLQQVEPEHISNLLMTYRDSSNITKGDVGFNLVPIEKEMMKNFKKENEPQYMEWQARVRDMIYTGYGISNYNAEQQQQQLDNSSDSDGDGSVCSRSSSVSGLVSRLN